MSHNRIILERSYKASATEVWELWTTKDGIESWWGPDGFRTTVQKLELRPGGVLEYTMTAVGAPQIEFMKRAGMPLANKTRITYVEIVPLRRLSYINLVDFVPGAKAYDVATVVELQPQAQGVKLVLTLDPMHDTQWTQRAVMGWESELGKLAKLLGEA